MINQGPNYGLLKFSRAAIIAALEANKKKHQEDYKKAVEVYLQDAAKSLKEASKKLKKGDIEGVFLHIAGPVDATDRYDETISFYQNTLDAEIVLNKQDFDQIFNDKWHWAIEASTSNAVYSSKFRG